MMPRIAVQILAEGFLHPAPRLERETVDDNGYLHMPVEALDADVQFFCCRVQSALALAPVEYILADAPALALRERVERFLCARFPDSTTLFLRSQATGRAAIDCPPDAPLSQDAAASVAVVMYSAAWDESETITIEGGGNRHVFGVGSDDGGHWAQPVDAPD